MQRKDPLMETDQEGTGALDADFHTSTACVEA